MTSVKDPVTGEYLSWDEWRGKYDPKRAGSLKSYPSTYQQKKKEAKIQALGAHCARCNYHEFTQVLELHHLVAKKKGGKDDLNNLILLCANCHLAHHRGAINIGELASTILCKTLANEVFTLGLHG